MTWLIALIALITGFIIGWWWTRRSMTVQAEAADQRAAQATTARDDALANAVQADG